MDNESTTDLFYNYENRVIYKIRKTGFPIVIVSFIVLLVVCIVLAVLYSRAVIPSPTSPSDQKPKKYETCDDERCFHLALELVKKMNKSVDPCQDFYAYACGGWEKRTPFGSASSVTVMSLVNEENTKVIKNALEQAHLNYSQNAAVMKTVRFYDSCMNITAIDYITAYGLQPLKDLIKEYGGWSVSSNYDPNVTLQTRIGKFARELNVNALFSAQVTIDLYDSDERILQLTVAPLARHELGFGRQSLNSKLNDIETESVYLKFMKAVGRMLSGSNSSDAKMELIYKLEKRLIKLFGHQDRSVEFENYIHYILKNTDIYDFRMSLSSFCNESGFPLPFMQEILSSIFGVHFKGTEKILAEPMESFKKLYKLYQNVTHSLLADYFMWQAVIKYVGLYIIPKQEMYQSLTGTPPSPRWTSCIKKMMIPFDMTLGLLYVDANFKDDSKNTVKVMVENIRSSFIQNLQDQSWMDEKNRGLAKQKALAITASIGYPSLIKDQSKLDAHYKSLVVTDNFFGNLKALNYFMKTINDVNRYGTPVDKHEWVFGSPSECNGLYYSQLNKIVFPAGIIQSPMYSPRFPRYMNYGGIGMVIGHEIMHGFDGTGRLYNKYGNLKPWWSDSADKSFKQKAQCFVKQYSNYKVYDRHINGSQTLNENIADNGGIKIAYDAYQLWAQTNGTEKVLPGLELNPDQLFFLGFAQTWCSKYSKADAMNQLETDKHSFEKYRVFGSLSNFKKFSEAFNCPANSPMNPTTKCRIW